MHESAIVPLESWAYANPKLLANGNNCNIGLFAEALIYYDIVYLVPTFPGCFNSLIRWFIEQNCLNEFISLLMDGSIKIYDYEFMSTAVEKDGIYSIWNIQGEDQSKGNVFEKNYLYNSEIEKLLPTKARQRTKIYSAFRGNVIEVKSDAFGATINNATYDYARSDLNDITIQAFIDEVYKYKKMGKPPKVKTTIDKIPPDQVRINWNIDINNLAQTAGTKLQFNAGTPLTAYAHANRFIWSAASTGFDLYLPNPISCIVGNKLYEASSRNQKLSSVIGLLKADVDFPDIQELVNQRKIGFRDVLLIRNKAKVFRSWIQNESERDRDAIIAYHNEILKGTSFSGLGNKSLSIFGIIGNGAISGAIGSAINGPTGGIIGGVAGSSFAFLVDMISKMNSGWKPLVFGNWLKDDIDKLLNK